MVDSVSGVNTAHVALHVVVVHNKEQEIVLTPPLLRVEGAVLLLVHPMRQETVVQTHVQVRWNEIDT